MLASTMTGTPSSAMWSCSGSTRRPSSAISPLTVTRPSPIRPSLTRREPTPARARTFCSRSSDSGTGLLLAGDVDLRGLVRRGHLARAADRKEQTALERLDDRRLRHEVGERRQVAQRIDAEPLEEQPRG